MAHPPAHTHTHTHTQEDAVSPRATVARGDITALSAINDTTRRPTLSLSSTAFSHSVCLMAQQRCCRERRLGKQTSESESEEGSACEGVSESTSGSVGVSAGGWEVARARVCGSEVTAASEYSILIGSSLKSVHYDWTMKVVLAQCRHPRPAAPPSPRDQNRGTRSLHYSPTARLR